jgi:hypothetical protein
MKLRLKRTKMYCWMAAALAGVSFVLVLACNSPFIPIPPPNPDFTAGPTAGEWSVSTPPDSRAIGARFFIYNSTLGSGIIQQASADGSMSAYPLMGQIGDRIELHWEKSIIDTSSVICRPLGEGLVVRGCY